MALANKTVVVTGGSRGIGLALVRKLAARPGNTVVATCRQPSLASELQHLQSGAGQPPAPGAPGGSRVLVTALDVEDVESIRAWADRLKAQISHIDVLINNAGVYGRRPAFADMQPDDFLSAFKCNTMGPFFCTQALFKAGLLGQPSGGPSLVVNMSSIVASQTDETVSAKSPSGYHYRASKAGLNIINKSMNIDLNSQGIEAVLMHPGYVKTDLSGGNGWIDADTSAEGILGVLESGRPMRDMFYAFDGSVIPW